MYFINNKLYVVGGIEGPSTGGVFTSTVLTLSLEDSKWGYSHSIGGDIGPMISVYVNP